MKEEIKKALELLRHKAELWASQTFHYEREQAEINEALALLATALAPSVEQEQAVAYLQRLFSDLYITNEEAVATRHSFLSLEEVEKATMYIRSFILAPRPDKTLEVVKAALKAHLIMQEKYKKSEGGVGKHPRLNAKTEILQRIIREVERK